MTIRKKALGLTAVARGRGACARPPVAAPVARRRRIGRRGRGRYGGRRPAAVRLPTPRSYMIAMITHEAPGDTFWDKIRAGAEAAAAKDNVDLKYSDDPTPAKQATLMQNASTARSTVSRTTLSSPDAMKDSMAAAKHAGIPMVGFNAGINAVQGTRARSCTSARMRLSPVRRSASGSAALGAKHPLCVIQEAGQVAAGGPLRGCRRQARRVPRTCRSTARDMPSVTSTIGAKLQPDPSIDYVVALGAQIAVAAHRSRSRQAGSSAKVVTFDLNAGRGQADQGRQDPVRGRPAAVAAGLHGGRLAVVVPDQQERPWRWVPVLTGPSFVDSRRTSTTSSSTRPTTPVDRICSGRAGRQRPLPGHPPS